MHNRKEETGNILGAGSKHSFIAATLPRDPLAARPGELEEGLEVGCAGPGLHGFLVSMPVLAQSHSRLLHTVFFLSL